MDKKLAMNNPVKKFDLIKYWLPEYIDKLPFGIPVGIRIYGHEDGMITFSKCDNSDIISYVGSSEGYKIASNLEKVKHSKEIPLGLTLNKAINYDFNNTTGLKEIILITDNNGNCRGRPCQLVTKLLKRRNDFKINVVAIKVKSKTTEKNLKCLTASTFGKYFNVSSKEELRDALNNIILGKKTSANKDF